LGTGVASKVVLTKINNTGRQDQHFLGGVYGQTGDPDAFAANCGKGS
jgi:hypothetical protein